MNMNLISQLLPILFRCALSEFNSSGSNSAGNFGGYPLSASPYSSPTYPQSSSSPTSAFGFPSPGVDPNYLLSQGSSNPYSSGSLNTVLGLTNGTAVNINFGTSSPNQGIPPYLQGASYA